MQYLCGTNGMVLMLRASGDGIGWWWIDASYAVHEDMIGHTSAILSLRKGAIYSGSWKQRLVSRSPTESELIGMYDVLPQVLWTKQFLKERDVLIQQLWCIRTIRVLSYWRGTVEVPVQSARNICTSAISM